MTYPVSVIIPTIDSRYGFLVDRCLPSVQSNNPAQIIVVFGQGNGNEKRNIGWKGATQPYLLFVDDDSMISISCLEKMVEAIESSGADVAYGGYRYVIEWEHCNYLPKGEIFPGKWSYERLKMGNFVDTTSLIRASSFPGFDPAIKRFQDWDVWLTMSARGAKGVYIPHCLVDKFSIDESVSVRIPEEESRQAIIRKHGL